MGDGGIVIAHIDAELLGEHVAPLSKRIGCVYGGGVKSATDHATDKTSGHIAASDKCDGVCAHVQLVFGRARRDHYRPSR